MRSVIRKLFIINLCIMIAFGNVSVFADEQKPYTSLKIPGTVISTQYDEGGEGVAYSSGLGPGRTGSNVSFNAPHWMEYTIDVEKDGMYDVTAYYASLNGSSTMDISVDDVVVFRAEMLSTGAWGGASDNPLYVGRTKLTKGTHVIKCTMVASGVNFMKLTFDYYDPNKKIIEFMPKTRPYRNMFIPTIIEAENFDIGHGAYHSKDGVNTGKSYRKTEGVDVYELVKNQAYNILINKEEWTKYTFNVQQDGIYLLKLMTKGEGTARISFDDLPSGIVRKFDSKDYTYNDVLKIILPRGRHTLKIESLSAVVNLDKIRFVHSMGDAYSLKELEDGEDIIPDETQEAKTEHSVYRNIYVSADGSDTNDGTKSSPFATLKRAKEEVASLRDDMTGDIIVNIMPGNYPISETQVFTNEHGGKDGHRVIYSGTNAFSRPVFNGGVEVTGWQKLDDYIWTAPLGDVDEVRNLYINGMSAQRARSKYLYVAQSISASDPNTGLQDGIVMPELNFPPALNNPEDVELIWNVDWMNHHTPVRDIKRGKGEVTLLMDLPYFSKALSNSATNARYPKAGNAFYIENARELLDEPGEFYFDKKEKRIYYYPFKEENLLADETYVPKTEFLMKVDGKSADEPVKDIVFRNLDFRYGAWYLPNKAGLLTGQADNVTLDAGMMMAAQISLKRADNITIRGCSFSSLGSSAITMEDAVTNANISGNIIKDCSGSGIVVGSWKHTNDIPAGMARCKNITVDNNVIRRIGTDFKSGIGIAMYYVNNVSVLHNDIKETGYSGITMGWGWGADILDCRDNTIAYNKVQNVMGTLHDGSHIYTLGPNRNSTVHDNHLIKTYDYRGGIYTDNGSSYIRYYNNVIEQCKHWWFTYSPDMHDLESYNNYSDTDLYTNNRSDKVILRDNTVVTDGNWPKEALDIMANAGLEQQFENLLLGVERPDWRHEYTAVFPTKQFRNAEKRSWVEAEDYIDGSSSVVLYGNAKNYSVGDTGDGTWLEYNMELKDDDHYTLEASYSNAFPDTTPETKLDIYVDGELILDDVHAPRTESWSSARVFQLAEVDLKAGKHNVKIVFVDNGLSFDRWRFVSDKILRELAEVDLTNRDPAYDEGVIVTY